MGMLKYGKNNGLPIFMGMLKFSKFMGVLTVATIIGVLKNCNNGLQIFMGVLKIAIMGYQY